MINNVVTTEKILIIDLEATCWENNNNPPAGEFSEIIEIGVCLLDRESGKITDSKGILVKPENSTVSPFCTQLTTITQGQLDNEGISLKQAFSILRREYSCDAYTWASFGHYDRKKIQAECYSKRIPYPMAYDHINVKELFASRRQLTHPVTMKTALKMLRIPLEGTHHRGVDDAKNIAKILHWCLQ